MNPMPSPDNGRAAVPLAERVRSLRLSEQTSRTGGGGGRGGGNTVLPWTLCGFFAVLAAAFAVLALATTPPAAATPGDDAEPLGDGKAGAAANSGGGGSVATSGNIVHESKGYLTPAHQIQVSPKVNGLVIRLLFKEGQRVKKGEVLAELESIDYQAEYDRAHAVVLAARARYEELANGNRDEEVRQTEAALREADENRRQLQDEYQRFKATGSAASADDLTKAQSKLVQAEFKAEQLRQSYRMMADGARWERLEASLAELLQAKADRAKAKWRLDNCTVRAPVTGTILTKYAEEGNIVNQMALNLKGSLCDLADLADMEVDLKIQERDISKVFVGQKCWVRAEAFPTRRYEGVVDRLMPTADRGIGAQPVRVKVVIPKEEEGVYLRPDMGVNVLFLKADK